MPAYRKFEDVLAESLQDPEVRAEWERTALARDVAIWLLRYRAEHRLTQTQLADRLGWRQPAVARLERGEHEPSIPTLRHLMSHLGGTARIDIGPDHVRLRIVKRPRAQLRPQRQPVGSGSLQSV